MRPSRQPASTAIYTPVSVRRLAFINFIKTASVATIRLTARGRAKDFFLLVTTSHSVKEAE